MFFAALLNMLEHRNNFDNSTKLFLDLNAKFLHT